MWMDGNQFQGAKSFETDIYEDISQKFVSRFRKHGCYYEHKASLHLSKNQMLMAWEKPVG
jgi:hypothetical protein